MSSKMFKSHFCRFRKLFGMHLRPFFNVVFNADSESVFNSFLSFLQPKKLELKVYEITCNSIIVYPE